jgi:divinyl chlorophyllide a 8-vinyl-reductase
MHGTQDTPGRVLMFGGTGTIGRATVRALRERGHAVVCIVRNVPTPSLQAPGDASEDAMGLPAVNYRVADVRDARSLAADGMAGERFDAMVSCMASRTGEPKDAWAIDHLAHLNALEAARTAGVQRVVQLSAICVQKPQLAFQHAKLAFERALMASGVAYSIVRPTAFFKSLSGQLERVRQGKPYLLLGDGRLTACKPISDRDVAAYLVSCLHDPSKLNRVLPIGGPGDALTPRQHGEQLFALLGRTPRFTQVPRVTLDAIAGTLGVLGHVVPALAVKAELAKIGRYYANESMLVWDEAQQRYDAQATPSTGCDTLVDHWRQLLERGPRADDRGAHAVF